MARQYFRGVLGKNCKFWFNIIFPMRSAWKKKRNSNTMSYIYIYIYIRNEKCLEKKIQISVQCLLAGLK